MRRPALLFQAICVTLLALFFLCGAGTSVAQSDLASCRKNPIPSPTDRPKPVIPPPHIDEAEFFCLEWKDHVSWLTPYGKPVPYRRWSRSKRDRLDKFFHAYVTGSGMPSMNCPDPATSLYYMTALQANDIYLAHVAHALALEYTRQLPWRLYRLPRAEIAEILGPASYVAAIPSGFTAIQYPAGMEPGLGYRLPFRQSQAGAFVCDPRVGFRFMTGQWPGQGTDLRGETEEATLRNLSAWFRDEVSHGTCDMTFLRRHALLKDRLVRYEEPGLAQTSYWATCGCQSAANTMADLARSVNIPLLRVGSRDSGVDNPTQSHGALLFRWGRKNPLVLVHIDDLYAQDNDWIIFPTTGSSPATAPQKDRQFFFANWVSPGELKRFGFDYALAKATAPPPAPTCASSSWCDLKDYGWHIGGWRKGTREDPDPKIVSQRWLAYFNSVKDDIMSDGKPCYDAQAFSWHPECIAEVSLEHSKIHGTYYAGELNKGWRLAKNAALGAYTLVSNICDFPGGNFDWEAYVDDGQGRPSPLDYSWQYYRDRTQEVVNAYGGCGSIAAGVSGILNRKFRP